MLKVGCCGFATARRRYWARFGVVEAQTTFYRPPQPGTLERWRAEAPGGFEFTVKAWQPITHETGSPTWRRLRKPPGPPEDAGHFRPTGTVHAAWERTLEAARLLEARYALFQCPARFTPTDEHVSDMRRFFRGIGRGGLTLVWEPRGDWPNALVAALCNELGLIHCVNPLKRRPVTRGTAYFRLHGITGYRYRHAVADLALLLDISEGFETVYCLFNNMTMLEDAARFQRLAVSR